MHNSPFGFQNSLIDHNLLVYCDVFRDADYITQYQGGLHPNWSDFSIYSQRRTLLTKPKTKKMCLRVIWFSRFKSVVEQAILNVRGAAKNYLYAWNYRIWPGPNINTFISHLIHSADNFHFGLPPHAIGKDYPVEGSFFTKSSSNTGWQFSIYGLLGFILSSAEGLHFKSLGLSLAGIPAKRILLARSGDPELLII